jgi:hypothetical protein
VSAQVREWSDDDKAAVQATLSDLRPRVNALGVPWPDPIFLVKTTGNEEGKIAYTRANAIVLPVPELANGTEAGVLTPVVAHELFHVLSRHNPTLKEKFYAAIGFQPCGEVTFPSKLAAVKITNPDAPKNDHCIRVGVDGKPTWVVPILFAASKYDVQKGGEFFNYLQLRFLCLDGTGTQAPRPATYGQAAFRLVDVSDLSGFFEQVGHNTEYIIHPEEILADNFSLLMRGKSDVPSPDILKKIQGVLEQQKRRSRRAGRRGHLVAGRDPWVRHRRSSRHVRDCRSPVPCGSAQANISRHSTPPKRPRRLCEEVKLHLAYRWSPYTMATCMKFIQRGQAQRACNPMHVGPESPSGQLGCPTRSRLRRKRDGLLAALRIIVPSKIVRGPHRAYGGHARSPPRRRPISRPSL